MKILHLIDIPWWSGLAAYAFDCIAAHKDLGHETLLACERGTLPYRRALEAGIKIHPIKGRGPRHALSNFFAVGNLVRDFRPDRVVAHTGSTHWIGWWWGKEAGVPVIRTRAISQPVRPGRLNRKIYSQTRWIVTASEQLRRECLSRFGGDLSPRVRALYPPVDNPALSGAFSANGKGVPGKRLGVLARLDPKKGHGDILKAFAIVQKKYPDAELHIAGSEENLSWSELFARANAMGLKNCVYHGFLSREEVWNFTAECSAGVIGSLGSEEVSRALEEWMSQGRPVVATAVGSIPEILEDGKGGYLVPPGRPEEMAGKLCRILEDEKLRERMARHNFESCRGRFSRDVFNTGWKEILA